MSSTPASSPCEPALGCSDTCGSPAISASAPCSSYISSQRALGARGRPAAGAGGRCPAAPRRARAASGCASSCTSRAGRSRCRGRSCAWRAGCSGGRSPARRSRAAAAARARRKRSGSASGSLGTSSSGATNARRPGVGLLEDRRRAVALQRSRPASSLRRRAVMPSICGRRAAVRRVPRARAARRAPSTSASRSMSALRALLGDRDQQPVLVLGVVAPSG